MPVNLSALSVTGFKSIATLDLNLRDLNVLIGANGSGKSNFVALFTLLGQLVEQRLQAYVTQAGGPDALLTNGRKHTEKLAIRVRFGMNAYKAELIPTEADEMMFDEEVCYFYGPGYPAPYDLVLGSGHKETRLIEKDKAGERIPHHVLRAMRGWRVYHFHDTSRAARVKQLGEIGDNELLRPDAANLAAFLLRLHNDHEARYRQIVETVLRRPATFAGRLMLQPVTSDRRRARERDFGRFRR